MVPKSNGDFLDSQKPIIGIGQAVNPAPPSIPSFIPNYSNISHVENNKVFAYNKITV